MTPAAEIGDSLSESTAGAPLIAERAWFDRPAEELAPELLGALLIHDTARGRIAGRIVEVEAYQGPRTWRPIRRGAGRHATPSCSARPATSTSTSSTACTTVRTWSADPATSPRPLLLRGALLVEGQDLARSRRGDVPAARLAAGPGNLAAAFGIDRGLDGADLLTGPVRLAPAASPASFTRAPRIGVAYAGDWAARPLRFTSRS